VPALELWPEEGIPQKSRRVADDRGQMARRRFAQSILDDIGVVRTPTVRHFSSVNLPYLSRCRLRTISYRDCYYREAIARYFDCPGFRVIHAAIRAAKG
jgi:hypothetical protein